MIDETQLQQLASDYANGKNMDLVEYIHDKIQTALITNMERMQKIVEADVYSGVGLNGGNMDEILEDEEDDDGEDEREEDKIEGLALDFVNGRNRDLLDYIDNRVKMALEEYAQKESE
jgi:hypothetical protein